jgi:four helix bundle protein
LTVACYKTTESFSTTETNGLTSQTRPASTSIAANIAEGYGRDNTGSYVQFLRVAKGSLKELETHIIVAKRIGYLQSSSESEILQKSEEVGKMLRALIRSLQRTV